MVALCEMCELWMAMRDQCQVVSWRGVEMITAPDIVVIAKSYGAVCTECVQITWLDHANQWEELKYYHPSVLDAVVLHNSPHIGPSYFDAVQKGTGWPKDTIVGFQTVMLLGEPVSSGEMSRTNMKYWRGVIMGLFVYEKIKVRYT